MSSKKKLSVLLVLVFLRGGFLPPSVFPQTDFYKGKTVTIIQGRDPGGTGDMRVRAMTPFLQKYIPGNPTVVSEFMPGGGSRKAANHIYKSVRLSGLSVQQPPRHLCNTEGGWAEQHRKTPSCRRT